MIASLRADLTGFETPLQDLMLNLNQSSAGAHSKVLQRVRELRSASWLSLLGLFGSAGILIFLLAGRSAPRAASSPAPSSRVRGSSIWPTTIP